MEINLPLFFSQVVNFVEIISPIVLFVLILISSNRRLQRLEDHLAELGEEVKTLTASIENS